jgi:hypothetical protein
MRLPSLILAAGFWCIVIVPQSAQAQVVISDSFNVAGGNSGSTGFGVNVGVNTEISARLQGTAASGLSYLQTGTGKAATNFSIASDRLVVADAASPGAFQLSADGISPLNFGDFLAGSSYEIKLTMDLDDTEAASRRMSFYLTDQPTPAAGVGDADFGFQLATSATSGGPMSVFRRIDAASNSGNTDINNSVASGLPFGEPVEFRLVINDSTDSTTFSSTYELFVNGSSAATGTFRFSGGAANARYLTFDVAPLAGPAAYDNFSVTVVPEPSSLLATLGGAGCLLGLTRRRR